MAWTQSAQNILDIGTGTGLIALMCAQRNTDAFITGIDANHDALQLAEKNFNESGFSSRIRCLQLNYLHDNLCEQFDSIICNPPFFNTGKTKKNKALAMARHEEKDGLKLLFEFVKNSLHGHGRASIIVPTNRTLDSLKFASDVGLFLFEEIEIRPFEKSNPNRSILIFDKSNSPVKYKSLYLYNIDRKLSKQAISILKPYYIKL